MRCPRCKNQSIISFREERVYCEKFECAYGAKTPIEYRVDLLGLEKTELVARFVLIEGILRKRGFL